MRRFERRLDRERRAEASLFSAEQQFRDHHRVGVRQRTTLYGGTSEDDLPPRPLRPLYPC
jgi:hypothetical protein